MPVTLVTTPDPYALTRGGRMLFQFAGSGRYQTQGVKASGLLYAAAPIPSGTKLVLTWNGASHTLHFVNAPSAPDEFTSGDGSITYFTSLLAELKGYFPIREAFTLSPGDPNRLPGITFTAKQPGPAFDLPESLPVGTPFGFDLITPGAAPLLRVQYSVYTELWLQKVGTSGDDLNADYERIFSPMIECDEQGNAQFDVGSVLDSELLADWPVWSMGSPTLSQTSARKYFICYSEAYGSPVRVGRVFSDQVRHALLGGVDYRHRAGGGLNLLVAQTSDPGDDKALRFGDTTRFVRPDEPQYLTFLNSRADQLGSLLKITRIFDNDASDVRMSLLAAQDVRTGQKITYAVGPTQQDLLAGLPAGRTLKEYTVQRFASNQTTVLSRQYRYVLNYDYQPYTRYIAYLNSLGAVETLATFGKGSAELNRFWEQAERFLPASYEVSDGQFVDYNISIQQNVEVTTGFRTEAELRRWNDFYRSPSRFRFIAGKAYPIGLTSKSIKQAKDGDTLFAHLFAYRYLYKDDFYSEDQAASNALPPLGFVGGGGTIIVQPPQTITAIDLTVPDVVRGITATLVNGWNQALAWGNHALAGYLTQSAGSLLFRRNDQDIPYQDIANTPTTRDDAGLTDVPLTVDVTLDLAAENGDTTDRLITTGGYQIVDSPAESLFDGFAGWIRSAGKLRLAHVRVDTFTYNLATNWGNVVALRDAVKANLKIKLSELIELVAFDNITVSYIFNYRTRRPLGQPATDRGLYHLEEQADGTEVVKSFVGYSNGGHVVLSLGLGQAQVEVVPGGVQLNTPFVDARGANGLFRTTSRTVLPLAQEVPTGFLTSQLGADGTYNDVFATNATTAQALFPALLPLLQPYLNAGTGSPVVNDDWVVEQECEFIETLPAPPYQIMTLISPTSGQSVSHNMQSTAIWVSAQSNPAVSFSFPDADHLTLFIPEGLVLPELTFELKPKNA